MTEERNKNNTERDERAEEGEEGQAAPASATHDTKTLMSILAYLGPLVLVPFFVAREDAFVKYHIQQGLVLLVIEVALWIISPIMFMIWMLWPFFQLVHLGILILAIVGIVHAAQGKQKPLPLVGGFAHYFKI